MDGECVFCGQSASLTACWRCEQHMCAQHTRMAQSRYGEVPVCVLCAQWGCRDGQVTPYEWEDGDDG